MNATPTLQQRIAFFDTMTEDEKREALIFLAGYSPDGVDYVIDQAKRRRERRSPVAPGNAKKPPLLPGEERGLT